MKGKWELSVLFLQLLKVKVKSLSCVQLFATPWTVAYQGTPPMVFSRQKYWSGLPISSPGDLPNPGIESEASALQADYLSTELPGNSLSVKLLAPNCQRGK